MALDAERNTFGFLRGYGDMLIDGIDPAKVFVPLTDGGNHPAWQLGHLAWVGYRMAVGLGGEAGIDLDAWEKKFSKQAPSTPDAAYYPTWKEIIEAWRDAHARLDAAAASATPEALAVANTHPILGKPFPTMGPFAGFIMTTHEAMHLTQLSAWRRVQGMPALF